MNELEHLGNVLAMNIYLEADNLESYIVAFDSGLKLQFWAENIDHAYEQAKNSDPEANIVEIYPEFRTLYQKSNPNASWNLPK